MPRRRFLTMLLTVIAAAAVTVYLGSRIALTLQAEPPVWALAIPALLIAALVWRLLSR